MRVFSFAQESTRYCNYSKDKFDNELTFIIPCWIDDIEERFDSEYNYQSGNKMKYLQLNKMYSKECNTDYMILDNPHKYIKYANFFCNEKILILHLCFLNMFKNLFLNRYGSDFWSYTEDMLEENV